MNTSERERDYLLCVEERELVSLPEGHWAVTGDKKK